MAILAFLLVFGAMVVILAAIEAGKRNHSIKAAREDRAQRENWLGLEGKFLVSSGVFIYFQENPYHGFTRAKQFILSRFLARVNGVPYDRIEDALEGATSLNGQNELLGGFGNNSFSSSDVLFSQGAVILRIDSSTLVKPIFESLATHNSFVSDRYQPLIRVCPHHSPLLEDKQEWLKINATAIADLGSQSLQLNSFRIYLSTANVGSGKLSELQGFIRDTHGYELYNDNSPDTEAIKAVYALTEAASWVANKKQQRSSAVSDATSARERALGVPGSENIALQIDEQLRRAKQELADFEVMEREISQNSKDIFNYLTSKQMLISLDSQKAGHDAASSQINSKIEKARKTYALALSLGFKPSLE